MWLTRSVEAPPLRADGNTGEAAQDSIARIFLNYSPVKIPSRLLSYLVWKTSHYVLGALGYPTRDDATLCLIGTSTDTTRRFSSPITIPHVWTPLYPSFFLR